MTWDEEKMKFLERYPDCPTAEDIGCKSSSESYRKNTKTVPRKKEEVG